MKVGPDHWLEGVTRKPVPGGRGMPVRRYLVIHFTAGASAESSISWWLNPAAKGANAHVIIDRDGTVFQCRPFNLTAGHAGKSKWKDRQTGTVYENLNSCSIGIELANGGDSFPTKFSKLQPVRARHKNGGPESDWEAYPAEQLAAAEVVCAAIRRRYNIDDVVGHDEIAPGRKTDPGPAFPMNTFRSKILAVPADPR